MKKLLVVDDEPVVRALIAASLAGEDWEVVQAQDGPSGLSSARLDQPDVILLDVSLPGMTGPAVLSRLRSERATAAIPVLYLTGLAPEDGPRPDGLVPKPFTPASLRETLRCFSETVAGA